MNKKLIFIGLCFVSTISSADYFKYKSPFIIEIPYGQPKEKYPKNRQYSIQNRVEVDKEITYLKETFDHQYPDTLIRIMDYVMKNPDERGYILNQFSMTVSNNSKKMKDIRFIIDYINNNTVALDNYKIPKNGDWTGQAGNSFFKLTGHTKTSTREEVAELAPYGIPFEYGYPNFTKFRIGESIPLIEPTGSFEHDYTKAIEFMIFNKKSFNGMVFSDKSEFNEYAQSNYAAFQYSFNDEYIDLIPLHISSVIEFKLPYYKKRKESSNYKPIQKEKSINTVKN